MRCVRSTHYYYSYVIYWTSKDYCTTCNSAFLAAWPFFWFGIPHLYDIIPWSLFTMGWVRSTVQKNNHISVLIVFCLGLPGCFVCRDLMFCEFKLNLIHSQKQRNNAVILMCCDSLIAVVSQYPCFPCDHPETHRVLTCMRAAASSSYASTAYRCHTAGH